ncbi:MAG: hypothetical protein ChlgKO_02800 [Chlamydiales bacterium]
MKSSEPFYRGINIIVNHYIRKMPSISFQTVNQYEMFMSKLLNSRTTFCDWKEYESPKYNTLKSFLDQLCEFGSTIKRPIDLQTVRSIPSKKEWAELIKASRSITI